LFVVRTISFKLLYGLVILRHARRRLVTISVTSNPTAEWIAGQVTDAFPWNGAPHHLIRDRDEAFGPAYTHRIRAIGIRDHPTRRAHPAERPRRAPHRLDPAGKPRSLGRVRRSAVASRSEELRSYYNQVWTHLQPDKNAPDFPRPQRLGPSQPCQFWAAAGRSASC